MQQLLPVDNRPLAAKRAMEIAFRGGMSGKHDPATGTILVQQRQRSTSDQVGRQSL